LSRTPQDVTEAELAVLEQLWEQGRATIRSITAELYPQGTASHYATVQKLLERLEAKNYVSRDRRQAVHVFRTKIDRDQLIGRKLKTMADELCGGSVIPMVTNLVRSKKLKPEELQSLRDLLNDLSKPTKPGRRGG